MRTIAPAPISIESKKEEGTTTIASTTCTNVATNHNTSSSSPSPSSPPTGEELKNKTWSTVNNSEDETEIGNLSLEDEATASTDGRLLLQQKTTTSTHSLVTTSPSESNPKSIEPFNALIQEQHQHQELEQMDDHGAAVSHTSITIPLLVKGTVTGVDTPNQVIDHQDGDNHNIIDTSNHIISSNSSVVSTKSTRSNRRILFKTLYECPHQDSPLYKNQDRKSQSLLLHHHLPQSTLSLSSPLPSEISLNSNSDHNSNNNSNHNITSNVLNSQIEGITSNDRTSTISCDESIESDKIDAFSNNHETTLIPISSINPKSLTIPEFSHRNNNSPTTTTIITRKNKNNVLTTTDEGAGLGESRAQGLKEGQLTSILRNTSCPEEIFLDSSQCGGHNHTMEKFNNATNNNMQTYIDQQELRRLDISVHSLGNKLKLLDFATASLLAKKAATGTGTGTITDFNTTSRPPGNVEQHPSENILDNFKSKLFRKSQSDSCLQSLQAQLRLAETSDCSIPKDCSTFSPAPSGRPAIPHKDSVYLLKEKSRRVTLSHGPSQNHMTRHISHEEIERTKTIRFDPRIWVHEVQLPPVEQRWYNQSDMNRFKCEAILRIQKWSSKIQRRHSMGPTIFSTGTGRIVSIDKGSSPHDDFTSMEELTKKGNKVIYTNPALSCEAEDDDEEITNMARLLTMRQNALVHEFKTVLIIDSHDIFLRLLSKGIKLLLPNAEVVTACTVEHACRQIEKANLSRKGGKVEQYSHGFDLILVEERLKHHVQPKHQVARNVQPPCNGSSLIAKIKMEIDNLPFVQKHTLRHPLIIGISAYLDNDRRSLEASGADLVWGKPPPKMDDEMRMSLLKKIMLKRNRPHTDELF